MATNRDQAALECMFAPLTPFGQSDEQDTGVFLQNMLGSVSDVDGEVCSISQAAVEAAENGQLEAASRLLTEALSQNPAQSSLYNDRAQVLQLAGDVNGALKDLNEAIRFTNGRGKVAGKAFAQRGTILQYIGKEAEALDNFRRAAEEGDEFAKRQLVLLNPMAALCNKMLLEVTRKLAGGEKLD